eukprot:6554604-Alexandrium_andersonii.AAC.1
MAPRLSRWRGMHGHDRGDLGTLGARHRGGQNPVGRVGGRHQDPATGVAAGGSQWASPAPWGLQPCAAWEVAR